MTIRTKPLKIFYKVSRTIHVYLSMVLLGLLAFFCITGILLNHTEWIAGGHSDGEKVLIVPGDLQADLLKASSLNDVPLKELQTWVASNLSLTALNEAQFDTDMGELVLDYQLPAGYATLYITVDGEAVISYRKGSFWAVVNDLHKGRHTGLVWSWVIDLCAVFMLLFSIAGLVILVQNKKYRGMGLSLGALGLITPVVIYMFAVPRLSGI